ncbi:hypothetical protein [Endozoicomonas euniceicola]|uniref:Death-on-curing protein n=1 Tax=Endozoicomonas euniceicola TaxID=1234143 RepID=A0ABY6GZ81_9GAMM|nr:hypothetical protein [Endozoicomonas euniceicola]UYM18104.1 hypothetical protein NX720_09415 [Endozoicomonas euniceicola]
MTEQPSQRDIRIYTGESGDINVLLEQESIWLTQRQLSDLLETSTDNISLHLKNIYQERELGAQHSMSYRAFGGWLLAAQTANHQKLIANSGIF